mgnify:CR=1 FL=1
MENTNKSKTSSTLISAAHLCKFNFVFLCERSWTKITPVYTPQKENGKWKMVRTKTEKILLLLMHNMGGLSSKCETELDQHSIVLLNLPECCIQKIALPCTKITLSWLNLPDEAAKFSTRRASEACIEHKLWTLRSSNYSSNTIFESTFYVTRKPAIHPRIIGLRCANYPKAWIFVVVEAAAYATWATYTEVLTQ